MCRRGSGFHEPECRRRVPREIRASAAAPEPPGRAPQSVFRDDNEQPCAWQSVWATNGGTFSLLRECSARSAMPLVLGGG